MTDQELVRLLCDADAGNDAALRDWLAATPKKEATDALRSIAFRALNSHWYFWLIPVILPALIGVAWHNIQRGVSFTNWMGLFTAVPSLLVTFCIQWCNWRVRKGRSAVFYLAERNDPRAIRLLASAWRKRPARARRAWNVKVEESLTRLLDEGIGQTPGSEGLPELRDLVPAFVPPGHFPWRRQRADLSASRAYLAVAALRYLDRANDWRNRNLLRTIANQPAPDPTHFPNRALVHDAARFCLAPPVSKTIAAITQATKEATMPAITVSPSSTTLLVQTTRRS